MLRFSKYMNLLCMKVIYLHIYIFTYLLYIEHSWRFIRILLYILNFNHFQLIVVRGFSKGLGD